ncbi:MAG: hypothetical protein K5886_11130 [Lachnospiraceae bacterium]|nr:hypothetical protein [Lachnospiraceae bacterium]
MIILYALLVILGIGLFAAGLIIKKKARIILIITGILSYVCGFIMIVTTLYFAWAVSNDAPYIETPGDGGSVNHDGSGVDGNDWRTWRSYTGDFIINEDLTVCLSAFDNGTGYAVYDSSTGDRIGSLMSIGTTGQEEIVCEDKDGDGVNELGIVKKKDTKWFCYTDSEWIEGTDGGCFVPMD